MIGRATRVEFARGPLWDFLCDETHRHVDLEGAIRSGKTTAALWKVLHSCTTHPGIQWLIFRYSDQETRTKLKPHVSRLLREAGIEAPWNAQELCFEFPNGARVYAFGLKAQDQASRYTKLRGLTLAGIYCDQTEELPYDVYLELLGRLTQQGQPHQLLLTPNPPAEDSWLAREFPEDNRHAHNQYYRVSIYENAHNLSPEVIADLEAAYPVGHAKHGPMLLGTRGVNVTGLAVYGPLDARQPETAAFQRARHERALALDPNLPLYESIDYGKSHPCVVWGQYTPWGDLHVLGGVMGEHLYLEDFAPIVQQYRARWFKGYLEVLTCCDPAGSHNNSQGITQNGVKLLQEHGFVVQWQADSNTPSVRLAMVERLASHMRRRSPQGEGFGVDPTRWIRISAIAAVPHRFLADGLQAGYVWDEHLVSVGNKPMRKPKKDGWYEHGQNCLEYLEHNFGGIQPTWDHVDRHAQAVRDREAHRLRRDHDPYDATLRQRPIGRGGYS